MVHIRSLAQLLDIGLFIRERILISALGEVVLLFLLLSGRDIQFNFYDFGLTIRLTTTFNWIRFKNLRVPFKALLVHVLIGVLNVVLLSRVIGVLI